MRTNHTVDESALRLSQLKAEHLDKFSLAYSLSMAYQRSYKTLDDLRHKCGYGTHVEKHAQLFGILLEAENVLQETGSQYLDEYATLERAKSSAGDPVPYRAAVGLAAEYETGERILFEVYEARQLSAVDELGRNVARAEWHDAHERLTLDYIEATQRQLPDLEPFDVMSLALKPDQIPAG